MLAFGGAGGKTGFAVTSARGELLMESSALNVLALDAHPTDDVLVVATNQHMFTCEFGGTGVGTVFDGSAGVSALAASKDCIVGCSTMFHSAILVWAWNAPQCLLKIDGFDGSLGRRGASLRMPLSWSGSVLAVSAFQEPDMVHGVVRLWDTSDADPAHWEYRGMLPARSFSSEAVVLSDGGVAFVTDDGRLSVFA
jgi:hypothetical protein